MRNLKIYNFFSDHFCLGVTEIVPSSDVLFVEFYVFRLDYFFITLTERPPRAASGSKRRAAAG